MAYTIAVAWCGQQRSLVRISGLEGGDGAFSRCQSLGVDALTQPPCGRFHRWTVVWSLETVYQALCPADRGGPETGKG